MSERAIVAYTESIAKEMAQTYADAPAEELRVWIRIAHQREAMVTQLYELSQIEQRLASESADGVASLVREVVSSIWAHEESHTHFLGSLRSLSDPFPEVAEMQGRLEGRITRSAAAGGMLARMLIAVGASLQSVPDFARDLDRMNLRELLDFHGELETTARMGYLRISELVGIARNRDAAIEFGFTFPYDVAKILCEERFHEETFRAMVRWVTPDGASFAPVPAIECVRILHDLCERNLSIPAVRRSAPAGSIGGHAGEGVGPPDTVVPKGEGEHGSWVSDGGLARVFAKHGLPVPVLDADGALSPLRD